MKTKIIPIPILALSLSLAVTATLTLAPTAGAQVTIPGVYSTGVDDSGNLLAAGTTDPHWTITSSPIATGAIPAIVCSDLNKSWVANTASSQWINATGDGDDLEPGGLYIYTLTFSLDGFDPSTASILGEWASDNNSDVYLNGVDTGISNNTNDFSPFKLFSITSGFVDGENELQFYVNQIPPGPKGNADPEGLQVNFIDATAQAVPEPATTTLLLIGLTVFGMWAKLPQKNAKSRKIFNLDRMNKMDRIKP
jgi:PEP-CTERM motif